MTDAMTTHIKINNALFYAYHGVSDGEQEIGAQFEVDLDMQADIASAASSDHLSQTLNYETVYAEVRKIVTGTKYYLLESLAFRIATELFRLFPPIGAITVRVRKPNAPVKGVVKSVEIELAMTRGEFEKRISESSGAGGARR